MNNQINEGTKQIIADLAAAYGNQFVRKDNKFFDVEHLNTPLSRSDVEKNLFLDWFSWCIQNEGQKPAWAPFFFSKSKGTGKSTPCRLLGEVFGKKNTAVQNNLDKLT